MRLENFEIIQIKKSIEQFVKNSYILYLFGSRVDDNKKGGDIDLLLVLDNNNDKILLSNEKYKILAEIKFNIGEQKIDLVIAKEDELFTDPFLREIIASAKRL